MYQEPNSEGFARYLDIARRAKRRYQSAALVFSLGLVVTVAYVSSQGNLYKSEARIAVENELFDPGRRRNYEVKDPDALFHKVSAAVFTRKVIEPIIRDLNLYPGLAARQPMSKLIERFRADCGLETIGDDAIRIAYHTHDPKVAQEVTSRLVSAFFAAEEASRRAILEAARSFGKERLEEADLAVQKAEEDLAAFAQENVVLMSVILSRRGNDPLGIGRERVGPLVTAELPDLMRYREEIRQDLANLAAGRSLAPTERELRLQAELDARRRELGELELIFTEDHPTIITQRGRVQILEEELASLAPKLSAQEKKAITDLLNQELKAVDAEITSRTQKGKVDAAALAEARKIAEGSLLYDKLTRALERARAERDAIARMTSDARIMGELEAGQAIARYQLVDPPELAAYPIWPNRPKLITAGVLVSLAAGILVALLLAFLDDRLYRPAELKNAIDKPVLTVVPHFRRGA